MASSVTANTTAARRGEEGRKFNLGQALARGFFYILVALILLYTLIPFYWAIRSSLMPTDQLTATPVKYFPSSPTFDNFRLVFQNPQFQRALINSTIVALSV